MVSSTFDVFQMMIEHVIVNFDVLSREMNNKQNEKKEEEEEK